MSLTSLTGWIAGGLLVLNFGTCIVMPWVREGIEECENGKCHKVFLGKYHKPIVWLAIAATIVHIASAAMHW